MFQRNKQRKRSLVQVSGLSNAVAVAAGTMHSLALTGEPAEANQVGLDLRPVGGLMRLYAKGRTGALWTLESATALGREAVWTRLTRLVVRPNARPWEEQPAPDAPLRFYRLHQGQ